MIVAGKDQGEVDNDYLLIPVNILDHEGPLSSSFPVENRLLPQGQAFTKNASLIAVMVPRDPLHARAGAKAMLAHRLFLVTLGPGVFPHPDGQVHEGFPVCQGFK